MRGPGPHLTHGSLSPLKSKFQTVSWLVEPFCRAHDRDRQTDHDAPSAAIGRIYVVLWCSPIIIMKVKNQTETTQTKNEPVCHILDCTAGRCVRAWTPWTSKHAACSEWCCFARTVTRRDWRHWCQAEPPSYTGSEDCWYVHRQWTAADRLKQTPTHKQTVSTYMTTTVLRTPTK